MISLENRFFRNLKMGEPDQCWEWHGCRDAKGYGRFSVNGKNQLAHRLAWKFLIGPIKSGLFACHHCDNPPCCNPNHIFLGSNRDNMIDAARKGKLGHSRQCGEARPLSKLTNNDVIEIRSRVASGFAKSYRVLGKEFKVSASTVCHIVKRQSWKHIP